MSTTINEKHLEKLALNSKFRNSAKSEFTGYDSYVKKPFSAYVYQTPRIKEEYAKFIEINSSLSDFNLFREALKKGYLRVFYYAYSRLERTGNNYRTIIADKNIRKKVKDSKLNDLTKKLAHMQKEIVILKEEIKREINKP